MATTIAAELLVQIQIIDKMTAPIKSITQQTAALEKQTSSATKTVDALHQKLSAITKLATSGGLMLFDAALTHAFESGLSQAGDLLTTLTMIKDTVGATTDQLNQMQGVMRNSSSSTIFSMSDTANMAKQLATSGLNADQINQTLPIFAQFAEVQKLGKGSSPQEAIQQAISSAHMVGAYSPDALSSFLNQFNKASFMQPGSTTEFFDTFKYLAPRASSLHLTSDDMLTMSALSNRVGLLGSMGGTNAADAILRSIPGLFGGHGNTPSAQMVGLQKLGLDKTIFDASGNFLGVANFVQQLQKASAGQNPMELTKTYHAIFGQQGMSIANILSTQQGQDALSAITQQMQTMKSIQQMQEDTNKSPAGQMLQLQTNLQNLKLGVFVEMAKLLNPIVVYLNQIVSKIQAFSDAHPKIAQYAATFLLIGGAVLAATIAVASMMAIFSLLGVEGLIIVGVITAIAVAAFFIIKYWGPIKTFMTDLWSHVKSVTATAWNAIWSAIGPYLTSIWNAIRSALSQIQEFWNRIWPDIATIVHTVWPGMRLVIETALMAVWTVIKVIGNIIWQTLKLIWSTIVVDTKVAWTMLKDTIQILWDIISGIIVIGLDLLSGHWSKAWEDVKLYTSKLWTDIKQYFVDGWNGIETLASTWYSSAMSWGKNIIQGIMDGIKSMESWFKGAWNGWVESVIPEQFRAKLEIHSPSKLFHRFGQNIVQGLHNGITSNTDLVSHASNQLSNAAMPDAGSVYGSVGSGGSGSSPFIGELHIHANTAEGGHAAADAFTSQLGRTTRMNNMSRPYGVNRLVF